MAENEYLDSRKARRWSAVAEAVRNRLPIGELGALILDRFRKTLRNISKDMPLAECLAAVDSQAELERAFDGVNGARDVKDLLLQAVIEGGDREHVIERFLESALENCLYDIPYIAADMGGNANLSEARRTLNDARQDVAPEIRRMAMKLADNVPLLAGMEGSQATRSCHPAFVRSMATLLSLVAERPIAVRLPYFGFTKGEVVKALLPTELQQLARSTVSCVNYPVRHKRDRAWRACGVCPACIFRRVSLHAAGVEDFPEIYDLDLLSPVFDRSGPKKLKYLKAFLLFVDHFADLNENRLPSVLVRHLRETDVLDADVSFQLCIDLYQRYRTEWLGFLARAQSNGCQWANLIDLPARAA